MHVEVEHTAENGGLRALRNRLLMMAEDRMVKVGVIAGRSSPERDEHGTSLAMVAAANHFGVPGHIPERPFMTEWLARGGEEKIKRLNSKNLRLILTGRMEIPIGLGQLGAVAVGEIQRTIAQSKSWAAPNAPSTVKRKHSSTPLIDIGNLRQSITWEVEK